MGPPLPEDVARSIYTFAAAWRATPVVCNQARGTASGVRETMEKGVTVRASNWSGPPDFEWRDVRIRAHPWTTFETVARKVAKGYKRKYKVELNLESVIFVADNDDGHVPPEHKWVFPEDWNKKNKKNIFPFLHAEAWRYEQYCWTPGKDKILDRPTDIDSEWLLAPPRRTGWDKVLDFDLFANEQDMLRYLTDR